MRALFQSFFEISVKFLFQLTQIVIEIRYVGVIFEVLKLVFIPIPKLIKC